MKKILQQRWFKVLALTLALAAVAGCGGSKEAKKEEAKGTQPASGQIVQVKSEKEADLIPLAKKEGKVKV